MKQKTNNQNTRYHVVILAGGIGERFGVMKQFVPLNNLPLFIRTMRIFSRDPNCMITLVIPQEFGRIVDNCLKYHDIKVNVVVGGQTRQESVFKALKVVHFVSDWSDKVLITDANRPLISKKTVEDCLSALNDKKCQSVLTISKSVNTSCIIDKSKLEKIINRDKMYDLLMPQGFKFELLYNAHQRTSLVNATDDMQVILSVYPKTQPKFVEIPFWEGFKLTHPEDYKVLEVLV